MPKHRIKTHRPNLSRTRKFLFGVFSCVVLFLFAELLLTLLGVQSIDARHDPYVGFDSTSKLFVRRDGNFETNPQKLTYFNPQSFPDKKAPDEFRIFCLGGSTTYGDPYGAPYGFGGWLETHLSTLEPKRNWRVVNCGGLSYASYRIAVLMDELINYEPDLFIVYTGHNEFLEERTYGEIKRVNPVVKRLVHWASYSKVYDQIRKHLQAPAPKPQQLLSSEVKERLEVVGPEAYQRDDEWRDGVLYHFEISLERIVATARSSGAQVILVQPASNLKDFTPFKSEHSDLSDEQIEHWESLIRDGKRMLATGQHEKAISYFTNAKKLNPRHAYGLWLLGDALLKANRDEEAMEHFVLARDEDVCPLRALSKCREIIFEVGQELDVPIVDYPNILARKHGDMDAVGNVCFFDHVHPSVPATGDLAAALCEQLAQMDIVSSFEPSQIFRPRIDDKMRAQLKSSDKSRALLRLAMTLTWAGKYDEALSIAEQAADEFPQNAKIVSHKGRILEILGRDDEALQAYEQAVAVGPNEPAATARLGGFLGMRGDFAGARPYLERAVRYAPDNASIQFQLRVHLQLGDCLWNLGDKQGAREIYRKAQLIAPDQREVQQRVQQSAEQ